MKGTRRSNTPQTLKKKKKEKEEEEEEKKKKKKSCNLDCAASHFQRWTHRALQDHVERTQHIGYTHKTSKTKYEHIDTTSLNTLKKT